ncbi:DUF4097 family beta strand repeat-containing protein [Fodinicola acaciae]|uniref:DUF4097 family beta strand repeat-containing protein n=1 Tax=Fodinicola acaciae TaxID=2681555 RepID=UPI0013D01648|nr:DUF4097 family beta strand repeat-containing protein [Fodinicola acaciae]
MPTFDTPAPISLFLELDGIASRIQLTATDRTDTVVHVAPSRESRKSNVRLAERAEIDFAEGRLSVVTPKNPDAQSAKGVLTELFGSVGSIDVTVELPAGSSVRGNVAAVVLRTEGRLAECRFEAYHGDFDIDRVGELQLSTLAGQIVVDEVDGPATVRNDRGDTKIGEVAGVLRVTASKGDVHVDRAGGAVDVRTTQGNIHVGEVSADRVDLTTAVGGVDVGVRPETPVWLDANTVTGTVRRFLDAVDSPEKAESSVEVRARTHNGDIVIRRSDTPVPR